MSANRMWLYRSWCRNDDDHKHWRHFLPDADGLGFVLHVRLMAVSATVVRLRQLFQHTASVFQPMAIFSMNNSVANFQAVDRS